MKPTRPHLQPIYSKGHTLRSAAAILGVHHGHLDRVLLGERQSRRLLARVATLPRRSR